MEKIYDLAIIGGGIAGAGIARDAALRGLSVILLEKNTFGSGTSSKSSKLIHGGIRYLELAWKSCLHGEFSEAWKNFRFVFTSLKESAVLEKIAPDLVKPIELMIPVYKTDDRNVFSIYAGALFYGLLGILSGNLRTPRLLLGPKAVLRELPNLSPKNLAGGVVIWDHWTDDEKLVRTTIESACRAGAEAHEHTCVKGYHVEPADKTYRITLGEEHGKKEIRARKLVNASGPWVDHVRHQNHEKREHMIEPIAGCHVMLKKFTDHSAILRTDDKRIFFVINLGDRARVGTTERFCPYPDKVKALDEEIEYLLCALEKYFPENPFTMDDVLSKDAGVRPLAKPPIGKPAYAIPREHEIRTGENGVLHVLGVKLTDHRRAAEDVMQHLLTGEDASPSLTAYLPL